MCTAMTTDVDHESEGGDPEWVVLVSALVGAVVLCAVLQLADSVYRSAN